MEKQATYVSESASYFCLVVHLYAQFERELGALTATARYHADRGLSLVIYLIS